MSLIIKDEDEQRELSDAEVLELVRELLDGTSILSDLTSLTLQQLGRLVNEQLDKIPPETMKTLAQIRNQKLERGMAARVARGWPVPRMMGGVLVMYK